jgi:2-polyprenyl-3-methyl-5-hydroxy-6-metoxy-1,4-benzoquinol methylase
MIDKTRDPVNQSTVEVAEKFGVARLGIMNNQVWHDDPRRLVFTMARYKFVSKMFSGRKNVLEVGCGDGFCARIVRQEVGALTCTDYDPLFIKDMESRQDPAWKITTKCHDMIAGPVEGRFDAAYSMDVLEHIPQEQENTFLENIKKSLTSSAAVIVGMPSLESQAYASPPSRAGHINCKTGTDFKALMERHFENVFLFSMNDEVVHTGFSKMAHYIMTLCTNKKTPKA